MSDDRCYFEMDETEAELSHMVNDLEFIHYAISMGKMFPVGSCEDSEKVQEINNLCEVIGNDLTNGIENIDKLIKLCKVEPEETAEESKDYAEILKELSEYPQHFLHEVDCAESVNVLAKGKILDVSDIKIDGGDAVSIRVETVDGQIVEMLNTDNGLLCSGWKEV